MTASPFVFHASPSAGFDEPFELLAACHERVERMLGLLERLAAHLRAAGADEPARQAARDITRYFDVAGPAHHEDEERHVLPRLAASEDPALRELAIRLHLDHVAMTAAWRDLRRDLEAIAAGHPLPPAPAGGPSMPPGWSDFAAAYREHVAIEDAVAYPAVSRILDAGARARMGDEMAQRRGVGGPRA